VPDPWRIIYNRDAEVADLVAVPAAVAEGKIAGRYTMAAKATPQTVIVQKVAKKGIIAGSEVAIDKEEAARRGIDVVVQPRAARGSLKPAGTISLQELMMGSSDRFEAVESGDDELATLIYTSGTTGPPKGVMLTYGNFMAKCEMIEPVKPTDPADRFASLVPYFHVFGLADVCVLALYRGNAAVLVPQYAPKAFLTAAREHGVTIIMGIPSQYLHLLMAGRRRDNSERPRFQFCFSGAAPLPRKVLDAFTQTFGIHITEGFGMTETASAASVNPTDRMKPGSIGLPLEGVAMRIVDEQGVAMPSGEQGEIVVKGPTVTKGYYNLPEETDEAFVDGWFRTGDIGYRDEDGYFFITDRKKDIIIKGGYNISPREIEEVLCHHEKVGDAAVVGYRKKDGEEGIRAFCVPVEGETVGADELVQFCRRTLAVHKTPDDIRFMDALPRGATGKVLRKELREGYVDPRLIERGQA
jgi:long-chain acyl-CoA synthetase